MVTDVSGIAMQISFFIIAINWPDLTKECDMIDFHMKRYGFPKYLKLKLRVICVVMITEALGKFCNNISPSVLEAFHVLQLCIVFTIITYHEFK